MRREKINELIPLSEQTDSMENDPTTPNLKVGGLPAEDNPFYRVYCLPQVTPDMARKAYTGCVKLLDPDQGGNERLFQLLNEAWRLNTGDS